MRIELSSLENGKGKFAHVYQSEQLDLSDERVSVCGVTSVSGNIRLAGTEVFVSGHVDSCAQVDCDRCLKSLQLVVNSDFSLEYITGGEYEVSETAELTEDIMAVSIFDGEAIDLDEIVKEQIVLAIPTRSLCQPDCKGFCESCGADKNLGDCGCVGEKIDPRWEALKNLMNGKS